MRTLKINLVEGKPIDYPEITDIEVLSHFMFILLPDGKTRELIDLNSIKSYVLKDKPVIKQGKSKRAK